MKNHRRISILCLIISITFIPFTWSKAQVVIDWQKCLGGTQSDIPFSIQHTTDGGYIVVGESESSDGDVTQNFGNRDAWLIKIDSLSNLQWQVSLGGGNIEFAYKVIQTQDNGYIVGGSSYSNICPGANSNMWFLKTDSIGNILWQQCYGGGNFEGIYSFQPTTDGGFIVIGTTAGPLPGGADVMVVKCDSIGNLLWVQTYGGSSSDFGIDILQTADNGYMILSDADSQDGDITFSHGNEEYLLLKIDSVGNVVNSKCLGGSKRDTPRSFYQTNDGGFIIVGHSRSVDGDVTGNFNSNGYYTDIWVVRIDSLANILWEQNFGGHDIDEGYSIYPVNGGGSVIVGSTYSNSGNVSGNHGLWDIWVFKIDDFGNIIWQKCFGGSMNDQGHSIIQDSNGDFVIAGSTTSNDYDVSGLHSVNLEDYWIFHLANVTGIDEFQNINNHFEVYPNPFTDEVNLTLKNLNGKEVTIEIYNIYGQLVSVIPQETIQSDLKFVKKDLNQFPSGVYIVNFRISTGIYTQRLIKL